MDNKLTKGSDFPCPECEHRSSRIFDSRLSGEFKRRRRECIKCKHRFSTYEMVKVTYAKLVEVNKFADGLANYILTKRERAKRKRAKKRVK